MSKIKYPKVVFGSVDFLNGFNTAIEQTKHLNKDTETSDHLLDTIGTLHTRNKGLQKGHATLTRRVQELEAELALAKQQVLAASGTSFTVAGGQVFIEEALIAHPNRRLSDRAVDAIIADVMKPEPTAADSQLADDIYSLRRRIACDIHEWSQAAEPVLSRLATREHSIKFQNELRRRGK